MLSDQCQQDASWTALLQQLPTDLHGLAFQYGALYRQRKLDAATLLRLLLAYATGLSMPLVTAWAAHAGIASLTPEALQTRLACARQWLQALVLGLITGPASLGAPIRRLLLVDGSHATRPGANSQDWRLHLAFDLHQGLLADARVMPQKPGESFARVALRAGDLVVADRNYGTRPNVAYARACQAEVLVRFVVKNLPCQTPQGAPFVVADHLCELAEGETAHWEVHLTPTRTCPAIAGRIIAHRLTAEQAAKAEHAQFRRRSRSGRHRTAAPATIAGWQYVILFTTVSTATLPDDVALRLYRCRWQIELAIKRYKSLCRLGHLQSRADASCQAELWAKLLLILLVEQRGHTTALFPPEPGRGRRGASDQPLARRRAPLVGPRTSHHTRVSLGDARPAGKVAPVSP